MPPAKESHFWEVRVKLGINYCIDELVNYLKSPSGLKRLDFILLKQDRRESATIYIKQCFDQVLNLRYLALIPYRIDALPS